MPEFICTAPVPKTFQELDQTVQRYQISDLTGLELFCQWQAIRDISLEYRGSEPEGDGVATEHSY